MGNQMITKEAIFALVEEGIRKEGASYMPMAEHAFITDLRDIGAVEKKRGLPILGKGLGFSAGMGALSGALGGAAGSLLVNSLRQENLDLKRALQASLAIAPIGAGMGLLSYGLGRRHGPAKASLRQAKLLKREGLI